MKAAFFILSLLLTCFATKAEDVILNRNYYGSQNPMDFIVPSEELRKVRPWEPLPDANALLSRDKALEIARKAATAEGLAISDPSKLVITLTKTSQFEEALVKRLPPNCCRWFYLIDLEGGDIKLKGRYTFLVTMSGFVAAKKSM